jgi:hypothetical protein
MRANHARMTGAIRFDIIAKTDGSKSLRTELTFDMIRLGQSSYNQAEDEIIQTRLFH